MNSKARKSASVRRSADPLPIVLKRKTSVGVEHYVKMPDAARRSAKTDMRSIERVGKVGKLGSKTAPQPSRSTRQSAIADVGGPYRAAITGYRSQSGSDWIHVEVGEREAWIRLAAFGGQAREAETVLAASGIALIGAAARRNLLTAVGQITVFERRTLIERPGWTEAIYALPDRTLYPKKARATATAVFTVDRERMVPSGSARAWRDEVAAPLAGLHLASFVVAIPFAALFRDLVDSQMNQGFELVGPKGCGKSTLQQLAASVVGRPVQPDPYWIRLDTTVAGMEAVMDMHRDLPMILDEANHYVLSLPESARASKMAELAFKLESGEAKRRYNDLVRDPHSRFLYLISTNDAITSMSKGLRSEGLKAASDRLLSIIIDAEAPYGAFEYLPAGFASSRELATALLAVAVQNHGHPLRKFAKALAKARSADESGLRRRIADHLASFRRRVNVDENDGSAVRVADAFGLVAAAGLAAKAFGILPSTFQPMQAAAACYRRNRGIVAAEPAMEQLKRYIAETPLPVVDRQHRLRITREEWKRAPGAILTDRDDQQLFVIAPGAFRHAFANHRELLAAPDLSAAMEKEAGRKSGVHKRVRQDGNDRVLCWRVNDLISDPGR